MIKVEAKSTVKGENQGTDISVEMRGTGEEIVNEALSIIKALMGDIKQNDRLLYMMCIHSIAKDMSILLGEDEEDVIAKKISDITDKSVISPF